MTDITAADIKAEVIRLATEKPNYVYPSQDAALCRYTPNDELPSCIMGIALMNLGVAEKVLARYEGAGIRTVLDSLHIGATKGWRELEWLDNVQSAQDIGVLWGDAVNEADVKDGWS